jgi:hypothetical protein
VVKNTSKPESTLRKKHVVINYHTVREAVTAKILRVGKEDGMTNLADYKSVDSRSKTCFMQPYNLLMAFGKQRDPRLLVNSFYLLGIGVR